MRTVKWLAGALAGLGCFALLVLEAIPSDQLRALQPYVAGPEVKYSENLDGPGVCRYRRLDLLNLTPEGAAGLLTAATGNRFQQDLNASQGYTLVPELYEYPPAREPDGPLEYFGSTANGGVDVYPGIDHRYTASVYEVVPLTWLQLQWVRYVDRKRTP